MPVGNVVVAAGVWSRQLAAMLGARVPLEAERGYHAMFRDTGVSMNGGIISVDRHLAVTPMAEGVRVGGVAEFAPPEAPPDPRIAARVRRHGEALFPGLKGGRRDGMGGPAPLASGLEARDRPLAAHPQCVFRLRPRPSGPHHGRHHRQADRRASPPAAPPGVDLAPFRPDRF